MGAAEPKGDAGDHVGTYICTLHDKIVSQNGMCSARSPPFPPYPVPQTPGVRVCMKLNETKPPPSIDPPHAGRDAAASNFFRTLEFDQWMKPFVDPLWGSDCSTRTVTSAAACHYISKAVGYYVVSSAAGKDGCLPVRRLLCAVYRHFDWVLLHMTTVT